MADEGYFRLWNPEWTNSTGDNLIRTNVHGKRTMTFEIGIAEAASAAAQFGTAADNALNGTTTPVLLEVDSSSNTDIDGAAGAVRAVHIIGISVASSAEFVQGRSTDAAAVKYTVEEVRTNGTTAVSTTRYYLRVMHMYATEWGTGGAASHDAEGNITLQTVGGATVYVTIDAGSNESNSSGLIYLYDGYWGRWNRCYVSLNDEDINEA